MLAWLILIGFNLIDTNFQEVNVNKIISALNSKELRGIKNKYPRALMGLFRGTVNYIRNKRKISYTDYVSWWVFSSVIGYDLTRGTTLARKIRGYLK